MVGATIGNESDSSAGGVLSANPTGATIEYYTSRTGVGADFTGTNDYFVIPYNAVMNTLSSANGMSISLWYRLNSGASPGYVIQRPLSTGNYDRFGVNYTAGQMRSSDQCRSIKKSQVFFLSN